MRTFEGENGDAFAVKDTFHKCVCEWELAFSPSLN